MIKKIISIIVLIAFSFTLVTNSYAQEVKIPDAPSLIPGEVSVGTAISPMRRGQLAPFTGVLLSPESTATIIAHMNNLREQIQIEVDRARAEEIAQANFAIAEAQARLKAESTIFEAKIESRDKQIVLMNDVIRQHEKNGSNSNVWFGVGLGVGFLVGVGATVMISYAVNQTSR